MCVQDWGRGTYGVGWLVEEAVELGRKEGRADEAKEEEPTHGPEHCFVAELLRNLFIIWPVSLPTTLRGTSKRRRTSSWMRRMSMRSSCGKTFSLCMMSLSIF